MGGDPLITWLLSYIDGLSWAVPPPPHKMLFMSSVVAVSKRLAVHSVLALPQCVAGWLRLRMLVVDDLCATARWQQGRCRCTIGEGPSPAECHVVQHFDDEPALQQAVRPVAGAAAGRRGTTEERLSSMEHRLEASDNMLQEVHAMVRGLQQLPATNALPAPPPIAVPVAMALSAGGSPSLRPWLTFAGRPYIKSGGIVCGWRSTKSRSKIKVGPVARGHIFRYPYR